MLTAYWNTVEKYGDSRMPAFVQNHTQKNAKYKDMKMYNNSTEITDANTILLFQS